MYSDVYVCVFTSMTSLTLPLIITPVINDNSCVTRSVNGVFSCVKLKKPTSKFKENNHKRRAPQHTICKASVPHKKVRKQEAVGGGRVVCKINFTHWLNIKQKKTDEKGRKMFLFP